MTNPLGIAIHYEDVETIQFSQIQGNVKPFIKLPYER